MTLREVSEGHGNIEGQEHAHERRLVSFLRQTDEGCRSFLRNHYKAFALGLGCLCTASDGESHVIGAGLIVGHYGVGFGRGLDFGPWERPCQALRLALSDTLESYALALEDVQRFGCRSVFAYDAEAVYSQTLAAEGIVKGE